ncbi:unnamed protein product [Chironomus riparius]|uniref:Uncharacterized protein n=1 Tax=Chironomus riparius TaxID=315576 RepID=A0A9N9RSM3_9DIPT|nr:unnamed protein product [Chironomus riparius]
MKFVLILYIFAIILVCNAGSLRRVVRNEPDENENVTESPEVDEVAQPVFQGIIPGTIFEIKCPPGRVYVGNTCRDEKKVVKYY